MYSLSHNSLYGKPFHYLIITFFTLYAVLVFPLRLYSVALRLRTLLVLYVLLGSLPLYRVLPTAAFSRTGVHLFSPIVPPSITEAHIPVGLVRTEDEFWSLCSSGNIYAVYIASVLYGTQDPLVLQNLCVTRPVVWSYTRGGHTYTYSLVDALRVLRSSVAWCSESLPPMVAALGSLFFSREFGFSKPQPRIPASWSTKPPTERAALLFVKRVRAWYIDNVVHCFLINASGFLCGDPYVSIPAPVVPSYVGLPDRVADLLRLACPVYTAYVEPDVRVAPEPEATPIIHNIDMDDDIDDEADSAVPVVRDFTPVMHDASLYGVTIHTRNV